MAASFFAGCAGVRYQGGVEAEIYPGAPQYIDGSSYWVPDRETIE